MKDRSLLDEMRAAIRGDLERSGVNFGPPPAVEEPEPEEELPPVDEERRPGILSRIFGQR